MPNEKTDLLAPPSPRRIDSDPELDRLEDEWWRVHASIERNFLWVFNEALSHRLRKHYLEKIVAASEPFSEIIELGCGTGWLCRLLAKCGAKRVVGIDFSEQQIEEANNTLEPELRDKVSFHKIKLPAPMEFFHGNSFVLCHGFLHHLTAREIVDLLRGLRRENAIKGLCILEPLIFSGFRGTPRQTILYREAEILVRTPSVLRHLSGKQISVDESLVREVYDKHWWGKMPYGPSPKEMPFSREEMTYYLNESGWKVNQFDIVAALGLTTALAGELLMNRITSEELYQQYSETLVNQALQFESMLCETFASVQGLPDRTWYFAMWNCE